MRLTLRTLLAYMDDILDPADHEELGKKIEASDFAGELIHRSRDAVRRLRLGAPEVLADDSDDVLDGDPAADANAVAEYLDNVLAPEEVANFERVCLEPGTTADMHLAEVTSCHHILTMVLGEPAEIDPHVRRRMYELPEHLSTSQVGGQQLRIEPAHTPQAKSQPTPAPVAAAAPVPDVEAPAPSLQPPSTESVVLPDYLRVAANQRRRGRRLATVGVLAVLGGFMGYLLFTVFGPKPESAPPSELASVDNSAVDALLEDSTPVFKSEPAEGQAASATGADSEAPQFVPEAETNSTEAATAPVAETDAAPPVVEDTLATEKPTGESAPPTAASVGPDAAGESPLPKLPAGLPSATPDAEEAVTTPVESAESTEETAVESVATAADPLGIGELPTEDGDTTEDATGVSAVPPKPAEPPQLGTYLGNNDVLLRLTPSTEDWVRLPPRTALIAEDRLLSLPKYRTHVVLGNLNVYLSGGTQIVLPQQPASADALAIEIQFGRLLVNAGLQGCDLEIRFGDNVRKLHLDGSASLAVDVHRQFVPGTDYSHDSAPVEVSWYLTSGSVEYTDASGEAQIIRAPAAWESTGIAEETPQAVAELPDWIDREPLTDLELRARDRFSEDLAVGRPVGLRLKELNEEQGARREIRTLSAEASLYVGEFEPFVKALNDSDQRVAWRSHIEAMRQAIARNPQYAEQLEETFIRLRGQEAGEDLMRMVRGFSPEEVGTTRDAIQHGVLVDLLRWLDSDSLDYRVLAIYNLDEIKGTKNLKDFRPDGLQRGRDIAVAKIRELIENNEFLPARQ